MNQEKILVAPSILSADFARLADEIEDVEKAGCDMIHIDVMDGHFVPNLTIGPPVVKAIRKVTKKPLDVHLMIEQPSRYVAEFAKAGADYITFHVEAEEHVHETIAKIRKAGAKAGLSLRPKTSVNRLDPFLSLLDLVLIMTVEPGFGGQSFIPEMMDKVRHVKNRFQGLLSVDGGINAETGEEAVKAGANVLVAGTFIFGKTDRSQAVQILRKPALSS